MTEYIELANQLFAQFNEFAKSSPVIAGIAGLWGVSTLTFLIRGVPSRIWAFIKRQSTTDLTINNDDAIFYEFLNWTSKKNFHSFIRTLNFNNSINDEFISSSKTGDARISVGYGSSFFFFNKHLFFMSRFKESASQTKAVKEVITLTVIGRNQSIFEKLHEEVLKFEKEKRDKTKIQVYNWTGGYWERTRKITKRKMETVVLNKETKDKLFTHIDNFYEEKPWYLENGIPYRTGIMLSGPAGTGKTSLLKAICSHYDKPIYILNLNGLSDKSLLEALNELPNGSIVGIEDIDATGASTKRVEKDDDATTMLAKAMSGNDSSGFMTLSGLLNGIDGVSSGEGIILIATTNHLDRLDPALTREGRFDIKLEIGYTSDEMINTFFNRFYPKYKMPDNFKIGKEIAPCKIQKLIFDNRDNPGNVISGLKQLDSKNGKSKRAGRKSG